MITEGIRRIHRERRRQIEEEDWSVDHDDEHDRSELALAAVCYAAPRKVYVRNNDQVLDNFEFCDPWPWSKAWDKRPRHMFGLDTAAGVDGRIRSLEKAGALIAAELDRLIRLRGTMP